MSDQFDWRTDDEVWADEPVHEPESVTAVYPRRFTWLFALSVVVLLALAIGIIYRQANERIETTARAIEEEVRLTHGLVLQANLEQDVELLRSVLSGRDPDWTDLQLDLAEESHLFDRSGLGLQAKPDVDKLQVTLAPDFEAAELVYEQLYAWQNAAGVTETVRLQQTAVYRRGEKWLYAPPTDEYWGSWQTLDGRSLSIAYPQRDQALVEQLAFDLEALIAEVCRLPDMACPSDLHLHLRLDNDPESLLETAVAQTLLGHSLRLNLPTPSLVGLPVDEGGYEALWRGYGLHLAAAIISQQVAYECCEHGLFHRAFLDWHLHELGLRSWPLQTADYAQSLYKNIHPEAGRQSWNVNINSPNWQEVYMWVHFLATDPDHLSPIASQRLLNNDLNFGEWLAQVANADASARMLQFIVDQSSLSAQMEPPLPLPQEDILYICEGQVRRQDFQTGQITTVLSQEEAGGWVDLWPLQSGYMVEKTYFDLPNPTFSSQQTRFDGDGQATILFDLSYTVNSNEGMYFSHAVDPTDRYFVMTIQNERNESSWALLDSADCEAGVCQTYDLFGWPRWSASGQNMLILDETAVNTLPPQLPLYLANARGQNRVLVADNVTALAWLDDQTIAYIRPDGDDQVIVTRELGSGLELVIARSSDIKVFLPHLDANDSLRLFTLQVNPTDPNLLLIGASRQQAMLSYYFLLERQGEGANIKPLPLLTTNSYSYFSPDGRLLLSFLFDPSGTEASDLLLIYNLETGQQRELASSGWQFDWSADGQWIALAYDQYLLLIALAYDYAQAIPGDYTDCHNIIWVNS